MGFRKLTKAVLTLLIAGFVSSTSAQNFEGIIELETVNNEIKDKAKVKWYFQQGNHKLDIVGTADGKAYKTTMLILRNSPTMQLLTEADGEKAVYSLPEGSMALKNNLSAGIVSNTGATKTIAGYNTTQYKFVSSSGSGNCWVTDQLSLGMDDFPQSLKSKGVMALLAANNVQGVPLEITYNDQNGELLFSQVVKSVEQKSISEAEFKISPDYKSGQDLLQKSIKVD